MNIMSIKYFVKIVQESSFSLAAEKLYISQPALSQHIKKLETLVGAPLLDRSKYPVQLTEAGVLFFQEGSRILQIYEQTLSRIHAMEYLTEKVVRFGISPFYSRYYLPILLPPLLTNHPTVKFEITEDYSYHIEKGVIEGRLDFALVPLLPENPNLEYQAIYQEEIMLAVPKNSPINRFSTPDQDIPYINLSLLKNEHFIALKHVQKFSEMSRVLCEQTGFTPKVVCETMNWDTLNMLVATGIGVGFVPDLLIGQIDESIRPRYYHIAPRVQRAYTVAYRREEPLSSSACLVIESFTKSFHNLQLSRPNSIAKV